MSRGSACRVVPAVAAQARGCPCGAARSMRLHGPHARLPGTLSRKRRSGKPRGRGRRSAFNPQNSLYFHGRTANQLRSEPLSTEYIANLGRATLRTCRPIAVAPGSHSQSARVSYDHGCGEFKRREELRRSSRGEVDARFAIEYAGQVTLRIDSVWHSGVFVRNNRVFCSLSLC